MVKKPKINSNEKSKVNVLIQIFNQTVMIVNSVILFIFETFVAENEPRVVF